VLEKKWSSQGKKGKRFPGAPVSLTRDRVSLGRENSNAFAEGGKGDQEKENAISLIRKRGLTGRGGGSKKGFPSRAGRELNTKETIEEEKERCSLTGK